MYKPVKFLFGSGYSSGCWRTSPGLLKFYFLGSTNHSTAQKFEKLRSVKSKKLNFVMSTSFLFSKKLKLLSSLNVVANFVTAMTFFCSSSECTEKSFMLFIRKPNFVQLMKFVKLFLAQLTNLSTSLKSIPGEKTKKIFWFKGKITRWK